MIPGYQSGALRGMPEPGHYRWRARTRPLADRAIAAAEAQHGEPVPSCLCGQPITWRARYSSGGPLLCATCQAVTE